MKVVYIRLVPSRYLCVLWGEKMEDGLRRAGCHGKRRSFQSSLPTKHVKSDWVRACNNTANLFRSVSRVASTAVTRRQDETVRAVATMLAITPHTAKVILHLHLKH